MFMYKSRKIVERNSTRRLPVAKPNKIEIENMESYILFLRIVTLTGVCIFTSMASATGMPVENTGCLDDNHCDPGYFCNTRTQACVSCEEIDCGKYLRLPGATKCTKSKNECGPCITGYKLSHGHCLPDENGTILLQTNNKLDENKTGDMFFASGASSTSMWTFGMVMAGILIATVIGVALICFYRKVKNVYNNERKVPGGPIEYTQPPPAYNFQSCSAPCFPLTECRRLREPLNQAIPFQAGYFMDSTNNDLSQVQVVPDMDIENVDNIPPTAQPQTEQENSSEVPQLEDSFQLPELSMDMDEEFYTFNPEPVEQAPPSPPTLPFEFGVNISLEAFILNIIYSQESQADLFPVAATVGAPDEGLSLDEGVVYLEEY